MNITPGYWRTVNNRKARVLCTDAPGNYPVIGYIESEGGGATLYSWTLCGRMFVYDRHSNDHHSSDLTEPWTEPKRVPCGPEDFPPGSCFKWQGIWADNVCCDIVYRGPAGIAVITYGYQSLHSQFLSYNDLFINVNASRSLDGGKTWLPCYKEI